MLHAFVSSLQLAGDSATLLLYLASNKVETINQKRHRRLKAWPMIPAEFAEMRRRDHLKVNMIVRTIWHSFAAGARCAVLSDVDVQLFPGWSELVTACATAAPWCVTQQPGLFEERRYPFNSGFLAFRANLPSLSLALSLAGQYEHQFLITNDTLLAYAYPLEQNVLSNFLFEPGAAHWAVFSPEYVCIVVEVIPLDILKVKVQHACGSRAGNRLLSMYRMRRLYYSTLGYCPPAMAAGPEHPCCSVYAWQRTVFRSEIPRLPPFLVGGIYGPSRANAVLPVSLLDQAALALPGASAAQLGLWAEACEVETLQRMYAWQQKNPQEDFLEGSIWTGLPDTAAAAV